MSAITRALCLTPLVLSLAGCALGTFEAPTASVASQAITGNIHGGQQPVAGSTITIWAAGTSGYGKGATSLGTTTSTALGNFNFPSGFACPYPNTPIYITAQGGNSGSGPNANLAMITGLGACSSITASSFVSINEATTAATVLALAQFIDPTQGTAGTEAIGGTVSIPADGPAGTYNQGLVVANQYTIPALINITNGQPIRTNTVGPLTTTTESAKLYSLADVLAACINSAGQTSTTETTTACGQLFYLTQTPSATVRPSDTLQAALAIARAPYRNVTQLFNLITANAPYVGLSSAPNDWTLGISYTSTAFGLAINGGGNYSTSTNMDIDATGNIFFPTNSASSHGVGEFSPASGSFSGPYLTSLTHPQYLAITQQGLLFGSDTLGNQIAYTPVASPTTGGTIIATTGFTGAIAAESSATNGPPQTGPDNIVFTANGNAARLASTLYRYNSSGVNQISNFTNPVDGLVTFFQAPGSFEAATSSTATACYDEDDFGNSAQSTAASGVTSPTGACYSGGVTLTAAGNDALITASSVNQICDNAGGTNGSCFLPPLAVNYPVGIAADGFKSIWVANAGNSSVTTFGNVDSADNYTDYFQTSTLQYIHDANNGGTMVKPYALAIDRSGNVWLSNAGCVSTTGSPCTPGAFTLSELIGVASPSLTPIAVQNLNAKGGSEPQAIGTPVSNASATGVSTGGRNRQARAARH